MAYINRYIQPGFLEVYTGPMFSGKTAALIDRIKKIKKYVEGYDVLIIKPEIDTRDKGLKSRDSDEVLDAVFIPVGKPNLIIDELEKKYNLIGKKAIAQKKGGLDNLVIAIDEVQFFNKSIINVINNLKLNNYNILASGLPLDFKGEPFGCMPYLLVNADKIYSFTAICDYPGCREDATRTQRLINGKPVSYNSNVNVIEGSDAEITYQARCLKHHFIPDKK